MTDQEQKRIFSRNLSNLLNTKDKTQAEVAKAIGVSPQVLNTWVKGIALPRMGKIQALADYFSVTTAALIDPAVPSSSSELVLTPTERSLIVGYRAADPGTQASVRKLLDVGEEMKESEAG